VTLQFADISLEVGTRRLHRGDTELHLSPKAFDLLLALVERRPNAVPKQELHDRLWPGTFVGDSNLAALVNEVRTTLGDRAEHPRFVRTVPRFGYAFCATIESPPPPVQTRRDAPGCWLILEDRRIALVEGVNVVGRDPGAQVWIDLPTVSRHHARVVVEGGQASLEDLGSKNGTSVRGTRVDAAVVLRDRDAILFGSIHATFRAWQSPSDVETRTAPRDT
jgi:DNA-binding winged helix-turn-helix (wHTH) protein